MPINTKALDSCHLIGTNKHSQNYNDRETSQSAIKILILFMLLFYLIKRCKSPKINILLPRFFPDKP